MKIHDLPKKVRSLQKLLKSKAKLPEQALPAKGTQQPDYEHTHYFSSDVWPADVNQL